jgi:predicted component of type VI protein secretion system
MYTLRLFHRTDPFHQLEARDLDAGELAIGRDSSADWTISDPERTISRQHCVVSVNDGALTLRDLSANGVFLGAGRERLPPDAPAPVAVGETIRLGDYMIVVEARSFAPEPAADEDAFDAPFTRPILAEPRIGPNAVAVPSDWSEPAPRTAPSNDASLLDAFCAGARLDASMFAGEEPAEVMRRLGAAYQQMILGLGDLMRERTSLKSGYRMERTRVRAEGNNPFKWASGQRLAVDLLRGGQDGFLPAPQAVGASFADLKKHLLCMLAGMRAAIGETLQSLSPEAIEAPLKGQSFVLKTKAQACWTEYAKRHAELLQRAADDPDSALNRAFAAAYESRLQELDSTGSRR